MSESFKPTYNNMKYIHTLYLHHDSAMFYKILFLEEVELEDQHHPITARLESAPENRLKHFHTEQIYQFTLEVR